MRRGVHAFKGVGAGILSLVFAASVTAAEQQEKQGVTYTLGEKARIQSLYPDASWLPDPYAGYYPDLKVTIEHFTEQSLRRDGVSDPEARVWIEGSGADAVVKLALTPVNDTTKRYAVVHPRFLDASHAWQARVGVEACKKQSGCWDPKPRSGEPWALFLPLGLPMVNQHTTLFLDYPPIPALTGRDYLNNYTMCRWGRVMGAAGAAQPLAYETIVDARPIAAPGSGEDQYLPEPSAWFDSDAKGRGEYISPMLELLTRSDGGDARPVAVFGSAARSAWAKIADRSSVAVLDVGTAKLGSGAALPWIATNHPDVTTYQTCGGSPGLVADEKKDFVAACWLIEMAAEPSLDPGEAKSRCEDKWMHSPDAAAQQALCIQAKLDDNDSAATCGSYEQAWNYCSAHKADPCATRSCGYDASAVTQPVPPPSKRPVGWQQTCNGYR